MTIWSESSFASTGECFNNSVALSNNLLLPNSDTESIERKTAMGWESLSITTSLPARTKSTSE